jgi:glycosyltransferase involved in cell wall biosynthesis
MIITIAIISKTEKIDQQVLDSVMFSDEIIIVVDSPVKKPKLGKQTKIFYRPLNDNFAAQRNFALSQAKNKWVLFIDSDEYVSTELAREIQLIEETKNVSGYFINRIDVCFHQRLLHGETGHTKILRLARKTDGKFIRPVHETWKIKGRVGELSSPLYHIKDNFISEFVGRMARYAEIDATQLLNENKPFTFWRLFLNPEGKFLQNYFLRQGILDSTIGLFQAYLMSVQSLTVRIFQWTKRN